MVGRATLSADPSYSGAPNFKYCGNTISDPKTTLDKDILLLQKFIVENNLTLDDTFSTLTRALEIMTTLSFPKRRTTSKSEKDLIRQDLDKKTTRLNDKISELGGYIDNYNAPGSHYTRDDLDILARRATVHKTKLLSDQLKTGHWQLVVITHELIYGVRHAIR